MSRTVALRDAIERGTFPGTIGGPELPYGPAQSEQGISGIGPLGIYDGFALVTIHALGQAAAEVDEKELAVSMSSDDVGALEVFVIEVASFQVGGQTNEFEGDVEEQVLVAHALRHIL